MTVNVILAFVNKRLAVVQPVMLAQTFEGIVASERVCIIDRPLSRMLSDMSHQFIGGYPFHHFGVDTSISLKKPKNYAFSACASSTLAFPPAAEVCLVNLNLSLQFAGFKLGCIVDRLSQALVDAGNHLIVKIKIVCHAIRRLLLVETSENADLFTQTLERFLFPALPAMTFYVAATCFADLERTTENALFTPQKVGRATENVVFTHNHEDILTPRGYEIH